MKRSMFSGSLVGLLIAVLLVSVLLPASVEAQQYSPPRGYRFTACYPNPTLCTGVDNPLWLQRMAAAGYGANDHCEYGCWNCSYSCGADMADVLWPDSAVVSFIGHGSPGYLYFWESKDQHYSYVKADSGIPNKSGQNFSINQIADEWDIRLMVLTGCQTARAYNSSLDYTNLCRAAQYAGVDCCIGFYNSINYDRAVMWDRVFFECMLVYNWNPVSSANYAKNYVYSCYGDYSGVNSYRFYGSSVLLQPAGYGV